MKTFISILSVATASITAFLFVIMRKKSDKNYILTQTLNEMSGYDN